MNLAIMYVVSKILKLLRIVNGKIMHHALLVKLITWLRQLIKSLEGLCGRVTDGKTQLEPAESFFEVVHKVEI